MGSRAKKRVLGSGPGLVVPCTITVIIVHRKGKAREAVAEHLRRDQGRQACRPGICRMESSHSCTRRFIGRGSVERSAWAVPDMEAFSLSTEEGIEGLGHDGRSARVARGSDVSRAVAGPALYVGHWLGPGGSVENLTIPFSGPFHKGQLSGIPTGGGPQSSVSFGVDLS